MPPLSYCIFVLPKRIKSFPTTLPVLQRFSGASSLKHSKTLIGYENTTTVICAGGAKDVSSFASAVRTNTIGVYFQMSPLWTAFRNVCTLMKT